MGLERTRLVQSYQGSRGYQLQFVLSLNYFVRSFVWFDTKLQ